MIYTSYFAKLKALPANCVPVSICAKPPNWYTGVQYKQLAPQYNTLIQYKHSGNESEFIERYCKETLASLDYREVMADLQRLVGNKHAVLLCYEKAEDFCHRHLVSIWLNENGVDSQEMEF